MRATIPALLVVVALMLNVSCKQKEAPATPVSFISETEVAPDSDLTIYGIAEDFGMSTFAITTDDTTTIAVTRISSDGKYGCIYGDLRPGDEFALLTCDNGEALDCAINLTQLRRHLAEFKIHNGMLLLEEGNAIDTVDIIDLSDDSLVISDDNGLRTFTR